MASSLQTAQIVALPSPNTLRCIGNLKVGKIVRFDCETEALNVQRAWDQFVADEEKAGRVASVTEDELAWNVDLR